MDKRTRVNYASIAFDAVSTHHHLRQSDAWRARPVIGDKKKERA